MSVYTRVVQKVAVTSRLTFLGLAFLADLVLPDHKSDGFVAPDLAQIRNESILDRLVWFLFGGLFRWDAQHFLQIATAGYGLHSSFAFFPLFPTAVRSLGFVLRFALGLNVLTSLLLASVALNSFLFVHAAVLLYKLSLSVLKHELYAFHSAIFFCLSPATIFFIAPYSESLFAFCSFKGMLSYTERRMAACTFWFFLSTFARSNGIVNAGFPLHYLWFCMFTLIDQYDGRGVDFCFRLLKHVVTSILSCVTIAIPFLLFQMYSYYNICVRKDMPHSEALMQYSYAHSIPLVGTQGKFPCNGSLSVPYFHVQESYWDVGFLKYYKYQQIPNFLLAAPLVSILYYYGLRFLAYNRTFILHPVRLYATNGPPMSLGLPPKVLVYMVHALYLTTTCVLYINVQVTTRMLASSSPVIYWIASSQFMTKENSLVAFRTSSFRSTDEIKPSGVIISTYFMTYAILGVILFSNNLPWT